MSTQQQATTIAAPPPLIFDDGSRIIMGDGESGNDVTVATQRKEFESLSSSSTTTSTSRRGSTSIAVYYEIERLSSAIVELLFPATEDSSAIMDSTTTTAADSTSNATTLPCARVALQFPDELLIDAPHVAWELEQALSTKLLPSMMMIRLPCLVFILGDTTFGPCCPDEIAAQHLQANVLIHYGHACLSSSHHGHDSSSLSLSSSLRVPVLYSFGKASHAFHIEHCVDTVLGALHHQLPSSSLSSPSQRRVILLYQVQYHYAMEELQTQLSERGDVLVIMGQVPEPTISTSITTAAAPPQPQPQPQSTDNLNVVSQPPHLGCASSNDPCGCGLGTSNNVSTFHQHPEHQRDVETAEPHHRSMILGGLELPSQLDWSTYTLLYIGDVLDDDDDDDDNNNNGGGQEAHHQPQPKQLQQQQWINILLRFLSTTSDSTASPANMWVYSPHRQVLNTSPLSNNNSKWSYSRMLQRRFYWIQRARDASVFGIVVGTLSNPYLQTVVQQVRSTLEQAGRSVYILAVGKINAHKLANFADVECFVLVACPEQHGDLLLLSEQRQQRGGGSGGSTEYHAPIITPLELQMALGNVEWGNVPYSLDDRDYLATTHADGRRDASSNKEVDPTTRQNDDDCNNDQDDDDDDDAPYFSLVTGTYQSRKQPTTTTTPLSTTTLLTNKGASQVDAIDTWSSTTAVGGTAAVLSVIPNNETNQQDELVAFSSSAASFLQQRNYRGLEPQWGETPIEAATVGLSGIASDYGEQAHLPTSEHTQSN